MTQKAPIQKLMAQRVSRREFLSVLGAGAVGVAGMSSVIHFLTGKKNPLRRSSANNSYGDNPYGG